MILYTVKAGDMLGVLAVRYQTTIEILMSDNSFIPSNQQLTAGWRLKIYEPQENAVRHSETAYALIEEAHQLKETLKTNDYLLTIPTTPIYYKNRLVSQGQIGFIRVLQEIPLFELQANGYVKVIRQVQPGELMGVYGTAIYDGSSLFIVDAYRWISSDPSNVSYDQIPQSVLEGKIRLSDAPIAQSYSAKKGAENALKGVVASSNVSIPPQSFIGSGTPVAPDPKTANVTAFPTFQRPNYKRPVMQLKNAAGWTTKIELRVLGFSASYQNNVATNMTNAGWMVNIRASGLPTLTINGMLLETKATNEFDQFMDRYYQYLQATKTDDYYSMGISTLFYKQTQYQGIVIGFSYTDQEVETFHRKYTMQMLVLKEKRLTSSDIANIPAVVSRNGLSEASFRSDIGAMLASSVTGSYYSDFNG